MTALVALVAAALFVSGVGRLGEAVVDAARAQSAADAVALAMADGGRDQARRIARLDGADVLRIDSIVDDVLVEVEVKGRTAMARASSAP